MSAISEPATSTHFQVCDICGYKGFFVLNGKHVGALNLSKHDACVRLAKLRESRVITLDEFTQLHKEITASTLVKTLTTKNLGRIRAEICLIGERGDECADAFQDLDGEEPAE